MSQVEAASRKRSNIRDVASLAGVSISTVSHVFSGSRPISLATQERVREAARRLNYQANPSARSLRSSRTGIIGLILRPKDAIHGTLRGTETFQRLLGSIATHALEHGLGLIHAPDVLDPSATRVAMDVCIVAHPYYDDRVITELQSRGIPVVVIDADPAHADMPWAVNLDHASATLEILDAMYREGRRRITYISGTEDNNWNRSSTAAYVEWCNSHELAVDHHAVYEGTGQDGAVQKVRELLKRDRLPDAILTAPSTFALGALNTVRAAGISVPESLTIAALTDSEHSRSATPPMTSLDLRMEHSGAEAVRLAIELAEGKIPPVTPVVIQPLIKWRESLPKPE